MDQSIGMEQSGSKQVKYLKPGQTEGGRSEENGGRVLEVVVDDENRG